MMKETITFEQQQLMSLYNAGDRSGTMQALTKMRSYLAPDEKELMELTDSTVSALQKMSDEEYEALDLFPDFEETEDANAE